LGDIADRQGISLSYLEQLFAKLRIAKLVNSVRGPGGEYLLARDAADMPISDVIDVVDEALSATRCAPGSPRGFTGGRQRCLTHDLWDELSDHIHLFLSTVTLYDVVEGRVGESYLMARGNAA
jgi:Rrf2 family iron-sulfur cluster assembly transcriptional regulator